MFCGEIHLRKIRLLSLYGLIPLKEKIPKSANIYII